MRAFYEHSRQVSGNNEFGSAFHCNHYRRVFLSMEFFSLSLPPISAIQITNWFEIVLHIIATGTSV